MADRSGFGIGVFGASVVALVAGVSAQDALRGWGFARFDTDAYALPSVDVSCASSSGYDTGAVTRDDGRVFLMGYIGLVGMPAPPSGTRYVRVVLQPSYSGDRAIGLLSDGALVAHGTGAATPPAPAPGTAFVQLEASYGHAVALRSDGVAFAWGSNAQGQTTLPALPPGVQVVAVAASTTSTLLLGSDGQILACGQGLVATGVPPLPPGLLYDRLWSGPTFAVARRSDGSLVAWGANDYGQCVLPALPPGVTFAVVGLGNHHGMAWCTDGALVGWGANHDGQAAPPALPPQASVAQIACGPTLTLVRLADGTVLSSGQPGFLAPQPGLLPGEGWARVEPRLATTTYGRVLEFGRSAPGAPVPPAGVAYVDASEGSSHAAALRSDGRVVAWGSNDQGQCAIPSLPIGLAYTAVAAGQNHTALLRSDGVVVQCGAYGSPPALPTLPPGVRYVAIDAERGTIALASNGSIQVATGTSANWPPPALPDGLAWESVAIGTSFAAGLRSDGHVVVWGTGYAPPPPPPAGVAYVQIAAGDNRLLLRRSDGQLSVWRAGPATFDPFAVLPELRDGESFVDAALAYQALARVGPTASYVGYGSGCAGSRPASRLVPRETPRIGQTLRVTLFDLPQDVAVMVFGWNPTPPVPLASLGMPGCSAHVAADTLVAVVGAGNQARLEVPIPNALALVGASFVNQALVLDPPANAAGFVVSDAAQAVVGRP